MGEPCEGDYPVDMQTSWCKLHGQAVEDCEIAALTAENKALREELKAWADAFGTEVALAAAMPDFYPEDDERKRLAILKFHPEAALAARKVE